MVPIGSGAALSSPSVARPTDDAVPLSVLVAYRGIPHNRGGETGASLADAFERLGHTVYRYGNYHGSRERLTSAPPPKHVDLLVYCECGDAEPQYEELRKLRAGVKTYWNFDVGNGHEREVAKLARQLRFDAIFYANRHYGEFFAELSPRAVYLPYAFDERRFRPLDAVEPTTDVGLVGSLYPERAAFLAELRRKGVDVEMIQGVFGDAYVEAINRLKIHLNLNIDSRGGEGLLVARVWETIGCGPLLLTQQKDGIEELFRDGVHVALFDGADECAEKIRFYLEHEQERAAIASAGHALGLAEHTYLSRARSIVQHALDLVPS